MVATRDPHEPCARARVAGLRAGRSAPDRAVAEALGRAQPPSQERPVPLRDVDADLLPEPRGEEITGQPTAQARGGEERAACGLRQAVAIPPDTPSICRIA